MMLQKISHRLKRPSQLKDFLSGEEVELSFYDIIYAIKTDDSFLTKEISDTNAPITLAFSSKENALKFQNMGDIVAITVGKLINQVHNDKLIEVIGINYDENQNSFSNFIFVPFFDKLTGQYLISPTDESIALLSIDKKAHKYMGVEATFFSINNKYLPEEADKREPILANLVEDISFIIPRISQPKGSANIICLLLNLENPVEEKAFIRSYKTFDDYTEVLFVTSELKLLTGDLEEISYNGETLEGVYTPIITRQKKK